MSLEDNGQSYRQDNYDKARAGITLTKYRSQIAWRRSKVKELLTRGYAQYEIAAYNDKL